MEITTQIETPVEPAIQESTGYDIEAIQKMHKIEKATEIHNQLVQEHIEKVLESITKTELDQHEICDADYIKKIKEKIGKVPYSEFTEQKELEKLKDVYFSKIYNKNFEAKPSVKNYKLAILDENNNVLLEFKNLETMSNIVNFIKTI